MKDVLTVLAELNARARELRGLFVVSAPEGNAAALREALYDLETAIHAIERAAAGIYTPSRLG